ncbi:hypothetical protein ACFFRR_006608 [Megaselia abdita]
MKCLVAFCVFAVLATANSQTTNLGTALSTLAERIKEQLPCGFSTWQIPSLAPYTNASMNFAGSYGNQISYQLSLTNFYFGGLDSFVILGSTYDDTTNMGTIDISFEKLQAFAEYNGYSTINFAGFQTSPFGTGLLNLKVEDLRIFGQYYIQQNGTSGLLVNDLMFQFSVGNVVSSTTGLNGDAYMSEYFNRAIEAFIKMEINDNANTISTTLANQIMNFCDSRLQHFNLQGLVDAITLAGGDSVTGPFGAPLCHKN